MSEVPKTHHILTAASNLLGITLLIIAGLHIANAAARTAADEVAWVGAVCFTLSCSLSYLSLRSPSESPRAERYADAVFMAGLLALVVAVLILALSGAL
jgi:NADH:ubiquinone oxidoreductase subunit 6 (subunit J)